MAKVVIGVDQHKRLNAIVVLNVRGEVLARKQFANSAQGYDRKLAEAKTNKEALRCLKRRISDVVYRQLLADAERQPNVGPGGQTGTTLQSSVAGPTPTAGSSDKPQPGPGTEATPTPLRAAG